MPHRWIVAPLSLIDDDDDGHVYSSDGGALIISRRGTALTTYLRTLYSYNHYQLPAIKSRADDVVGLSLSHSH